MERLLRRDRAVVITALCLVVAASWIYILAGAGMGMPALDMISLSTALGWPVEREVADIPTGITNAMAAIAMPADWMLRYAVLMFFMWWVMMLAMMLPSAAPMILLHAMVARRGSRDREETGGLVPTAAFASGYLLVWGLFSVIATTLQWAFEGLGLLSPMMMNSTNSLFAGLILLFAGAYQLSPVKQACLRHCRGPIQFLSQHWRPGGAGALRMGLHHGTYCLGCCWGLMAVLFFGGIMNLYWIIGLALMVLLEKVLPLGHRVSKITGASLLMGGAGFLYRALV